MPRTSSFTRYGHLRFSSKPSYGEAIYRQLINSLGGQFSTEIGSRSEAQIYATAMHLARVRGERERAVNQMNPRKVVAMLPVREDEYGLVPGPNDTIPDRQKALTAAYLLAQGAKESAILTELTAAIGSDFLCFRVTKPTELVSYPDDPEDGPANWVDITTQPKTVRLTGSVGDAGMGNHVAVTYEPADRMTPVTIDVGDKVLVSVNNIGLAEHVTVTATSPGSFTAVFQRSHDVGDIATTAYFPYWISNQGHVLIVVTPAAALDPEKRRKVNLVMESIARSVWTWDIVADGGSGQTAAYTIGDPVLGQIGYTGIGTATFP